MAPAAAAAGGGTLVVEDLEWRGPAMRLDDPDLRTAAFGAEVASTSYLPADPAAVTAGDRERARAAADFRTRFFPLRASDSALLAPQLLLANVDPGALKRLQGLYGACRVDFLVDTLRTEEIPEGALDECEKHVQALEAFTAELGKERALYQGASKLSQCKAFWNDLLEAAAQFADVPGFQHVHLLHMIQAACKRVQALQEPQHGLRLPTEAQAAAKAPAHRRPAAPRAGGGAKRAARNPALINKRKRCEEVPRDANGKPKMPVHLGPSQYVLSLGQVVHDRPGFHAPNYIWPAGYKAVRVFFSAKDPTQRVAWTCEIVDTGGDAPEFRLFAADDPLHVLKGPTATAVWTQVRLTDARTRRRPPPRGAPC